MEQIYIPKQDYKVLVRCFTYNQSKYIEDALKGFAMQQTEIPFVCLVMDDCSTDGEQEVIKAWMERECDMVKAEYIDIELSNVIIVPHKSNTSCTFAFYFLKQNLYGLGKKKMNMVYPWRECCKYEAICEGDDYWIVPDKLEKQVKIMDENPSISLCFSDVNDQFEDDSKLTRNVSNYYNNEKLPNKKNELFYYILLGKCRIQTLTTLFRIESLKKIKPNNKAFMMGDTPLWLDLSQQGFFYFFPNITGVYRRHEGSACRNPKTFKQFRLSMYDMRIYYCNKYGYGIPFSIRKLYCEALVDCIYSGIVIDIDNNEQINKINSFQKLVIKKSINNNLLKLIVRLIWKIEHIIMK